MLTSLSRFWGLLFLALLFAGCHDNAGTVQATGTQTGSQTIAPGDVNRRIEGFLRASMAMPDDVQIEFGERKPSEQFPGYDGMTITFVSAGGSHRSPLDFVISKDNKTIFSLHRYDLTSQAFAKTMDQIDIKGRPFRGGSNAKVVIVNYDDFQCPFCARMHKSLFPATLDHYGNKIKVVYKDFPLTAIHPWAMHAAILANCLAQQSNDAFWGFADNVHARQSDIVGTQEHPRSANEQTDEVDKIAADQAQQHHINLNNYQSCVAAADRSPIEAEIQEAGALGVQATPTMFVNGIRIGGSMSEENLRKIIDLALQDAGETPPPSTGSGNAGQ